MNPILEKLLVIPSIYRGTFLDLDEEHNRAYKAYPFPWPHEKQYECYTKIDVEQRLDEREKAFETFLEDFGLSWKLFENKIVVDLGAGVGWDSLNIARHGAKMVYAIDNSDVSIQHGLRFSELLESKNITLIRYSLYEIDRLELQADIIIVKGVLHIIYNLPKFIKALRHVTRTGTQLLMTHSSYFSRLGFTHYFYNHLSWALGGTDLEKRIDIGTRLYRGYHWQFADSLKRHRINDLAGVFYMARSPLQIIKMFQREGFVIRKIPWRAFSHLYHNLITHHQQMFAIEKNYLWRKSRRSSAIALVELLNFFSCRFTFLDRLLGMCYIFLFLQPTNLFLAQGGSSFLASPRAGAVQDNSVLS